MLSSQVAPHQPTSSGPPAPGPASLHRLAAAGHSVASSPSSGGGDSPPTSASHHLLAATSAAAASVLQAASAASAQIAYEGRVSLLPGGGAGAGTDPVETVAGAGGVRHHTVMPTHHYGGQLHGVNFSLFNHNNHHHHNFQAKENGSGAGGGVVPENGGRGGYEERETSPSTSEGGGSPRTDDLLPSEDKPVSEEEDEEMEERRETNGRDGSFNNGELNREQDSNGKSEGEDEATEKQNGDQERHIPAIMDSPRDTEDPEPGTKDVDKSHEDEDEGVEVEEEDVEDEGEGDGDLGVKPLEATDPGGEEEEEEVDVTESSNKPSHPAGLTIRQDMRGALADNVRNISEEASDDEELRIDLEMAEGGEAPDEQFETLNRSVEKMPPFVGFQPYVHMKEGDDSLNSLEKLQQVLNNRMFNRGGGGGGSGEGGEGEATERTDDNNGNECSPRDTEYKFLLPDDEEGMVYSCHHCSYSATTRVQFNAHVNTHYEFQCIKCDFENKSEYEYVRHLKEEHHCTPEDLEEAEVRVPRVNSQGKVKTFKCKQCEFVAVTKTEFWKHGRGHIKPEKLLHCPKCIFVTEYKHHLEYHLRNHYGTKPFKCQHCNYNCVNKSMLNSHMKSHTNVYQYRCADCTYATKYCHSLKLHLRKYGHKPAMVLNNDGSPNPLPAIGDAGGGGRRPKSGKKGGGNQAADDMFPPSMVPQPLPFPNLPPSFMQMHLQQFREQFANREQKTAPPPPPPELALSPHHHHSQQQQHHHHLQQQQQHPKMAQITPFRLNNPSGELTHHKMARNGNHTTSPPFHLDSAARHFLGGLQQPDSQLEQQRLKCDKCEFCTTSKDVFRNHMMLHASTERGALHHLLSSPLHNTSGSQKRTLADLNKSLEEREERERDFQNFTRKLQSLSPASSLHNPSPHSSPYMKHSSEPGGESSSSPLNNSSSLPSSSSPSSHLQAGHLSYLSRMGISSPLLQSLMPNPAIRALIEERNRDSLGSSFSSSADSQRTRTPENSVSPPGAEEDRAGCVDDDVPTSNSSQAPLPPNKRLKADIFSALYASRVNEQLEKDSTTAAVSSACESRSQGGSPASGAALDLSKETVGSNGVVGGGSHGSSSDVESGSNPRSHSSSPSAFSAGSGSSNTKNRRKGKAYKIERRTTDRDSEEETVGGRASPSSAAYPMPGLMPINHRNGGGVGPGVRVSDEVEDSLGLRYSEQAACKFCGIAFQNTVMYRVHMSYHGYEDPFKCNLCGEEAQDALAFFLHIARREHALQ